MSGLIALGRTERLTSWRITFQPSFSRSFWVCVNCVAKLVVKVLSTSITTVPRFSTMANWMAEFTCP